MYADKPGAFAAEPMTRAGAKVRRPPAATPPCLWCEKQPPDVAERDRRPETAVEMGDGEWAAYQHYLECKAVVAFPDDGWVRYDASMIRQVEELADRVHAARAGRNRG